MREIDASHGPTAAGRLQPPTTRPGIVPRRTLVERMLTRDAERVFTLVSPPGYGKTTVLAQWSATQGRKVAWISVDKTDNDPSVLLADAAVALSHVGLVDPALPHSLAQGHSAPTALARFSPALTSIADPVALVFDHVELVDNPESLDVITELAVRLPAGSRLAVATRTQPPLPTPLLRSRGDVVEIGVDELAMDHGEAHLLLEGAGVHLTDDDVDRLLEQTEGWPVGLYLAALASKAGGNPVGAAFAFRGDDRLMGDYLRTELLAQLDPSTAEFLTRTAVLDHLSGPLCDAVLETRGSQAILEALESSNLLLVPLDRHREWYRYHRLFRDLLVAEVSRNEPDLVAELHSRAAQWLEANRMPEAAITHAQKAGDAERVARLITTAAQPAYAAGRAATVRQWFEWFRTEGLIEKYANVAVLGSTVEALLGQPASSERWQAAAEAGTFDGTLPDGSGIDSWRAYLRALTCRAGVAQMRVDAQCAVETLAPGSPFRATALLLEALSHMLEGQHDAADPIFVHAYDVGVYLGAPAAAAVASAERALIALERRDWDEARTLADRAVALVEDRGLQGNVESACVYAVAARLAIHDGDLATARDYVTRTARVRPLLTYAVPATAQFQLELAKAYLELADPAGARTVLREMRDILRQRPDIGLLAEQADAVQAALDDIRQGSIGASALTIAELRVLSYLSTHLSFREIGERLHVSRHTVKTQAISLYRKLGVSSRSEAIDRAEQTGLLAR